MRKFFGISLIATLFFVLTVVGADPLPPAKSVPEHPYVQKFVVTEKFEVPVQKIEGAEGSIDLGEVVMLNLSKIDKTPKDFVSYTVEWRVFDKGKEKKFFKSTDGNGIFFGAGVNKRKLLVFASVSYLYVVKDGDKFVEAGVRSQFLTTTVSIGGGDDEPSGPDTPDEPTFVDGVYKLAAKSYKLAKDKVMGAKKVAASAELSKSFAASAAKIAAGQEVNKADDVRKILESTTEENRKALTRVGVEWDVWDSFFVALQEEIYGLYVSGKLKSKNDFATAWREIASGLQAIK
jgi:hypothetical protein